MKISVTHKLFLAMLTAAGLAVVSFALIMQWSLSRGFLRFINSMEQSGISRLAAKLEDNYSTNRNWDLLKNDPKLWRKLVESSISGGLQPPSEGLQTAPPMGEMLPVSPSSLGRPPEGPLPVERMPPLPPPRLLAAENSLQMPLPQSHHIEQRLFLLDANRKVLVGHGEVPVDNAATPLRYQGKVVGYLGLLPHKNISDAPQQRFLKEQKLAFTLAAGVVVILAAVLSLLLARRLVSPLRLLAQATHSLAAGKFTVRVPVTSQDELGQLAKDFNSLALALEKSEQTRRQWVADISHELRTPLAILRGEVEALLDGIRQPTTGTIHSLHGEVLRIGRLVDDLFQLSLSDAGALTYRKSELDLTHVLMETVSAYHPEFLAKGISLDMDISDDLSISVFADPERLHQLFANLLDNSLKYTDSGGRLQITLQRHNSNVAIDFQDSTPGVPASELDKLFERLYRVESSRNRSTGGAGLGLAICRNIVEAHGGSIQAQASMLGGLWIRIELPGAGS